MANNVYCANSLTGGGIGALDSLDGAGLVDGDAAFVVDASNNIIYAYTLNATVAGAVNSPSLIPPSTNAGDKRWQLVRVYGKDGVSFTDGTNIGDLQFTANELEMYSQRNSGVVKLMAKDGAGNKETLIKATGGGAVELYHDNTKKFETSAAGATLTGALAATGAVSGTAINDTGGTSFLRRRNVIINGNPIIWQRGPTGNVTNDSKFGADRWKLGNGSTTSVLQMSQSGEVPTAAQSGVYGYESSIMILVDTADAALAAGEYATIRQIVEGYNIRRLWGKNITLSFWVRSPTAGVYCVSLTNSGSDRTYLAEYTIDLANTWEFKSITIPMQDVAAGGTWDFQNGAGLGVSFCLGTGATYQGVAGWQAGNYFGTANQVNFIATGAAEFRISLIQLEEGSIATPFELRDFSEELAMCQRYYEKSYPYAVAVGDVSQPGMNVCIKGNGSTAGMAYFKVSKRAIVTPVVYSPGTGTVDKAYNHQASADQDAVLFAVSENSFGMTTAAGNVSDAISYHWTVDAEL